MSRADHWFKFYYHRILVSCSGWKDDEFGAFVKLLIHQFDKGFVPKSENELKRIISSYKKNWPLLSTKFKEEEPGKLINHVMDEIRKDRQKKAEANKINGVKGGRPPDKNKTQNNPSGYKNERHIYSNSDSNSEFEDKDGAEEKETFYLPPNGFFSDEIEKGCLLTETQTGATIEFIRLKCSKKINEKDVSDEWEAFKIQQFGKHEWYNSFEDLLSHFRNSLKLEKQKKNGTETNSTIVKSRPGKSTGAVALYQDLKNDLTGS